MGADIYHKDKFGDTALYMASRNGYEDCCKYLIDKGLKFFEQEQAAKIKFVPGPMYPKLAAATLDKIVDYLCYPKYFGKKKKNKRIISH